MSVYQEVHGVRRSMLQRRMHNAIVLLKIELVDHEVNVFNKVFILIQDIAKFSYSGSVA